MSGSSEAPDGAPNPAASAAAPSAPTENKAAEASPVVVDLGARIAELEGQIADLTDRLLRSHAEMDNIRKRTERERVDTQKYAVTKFAADVLAIGDNLQRARASVPADAAASDPALRALVDGVQMTEREFANVLSRHGVKLIPAKGEAFNPHLHQAVMEQQNADVAAGSIVQVFQDGYTIEDRLLRPSMVVVAKGGFKPVKPADDNGRPAAGVDEAPATTAATEPEAAAAADPVQAAAEAAAKSGGGQTSGGGFGKRTTPPGGDAAG